jgi:hypothetical protein
MHPSRRSAACCWLACGTARGFRQEPRLQKVLSAGAVRIALLLGATIVHAEYTDVTLTVRAYIDGRSQAVDASVPMRCSAS